MSYQYVPEIRKAAIGWQWHIAGIPDNPKGIRTETQAFWRPTRNGAVRAARRSIRRNHRNDWTKICPTMSQT